MRRATGAAGSAEGTAELPAEDDREHESERGDGDDD
jgi:hypothetical protein